MQRKAHVQRGGCRPQAGTLHSFPRYPLKLRYLNSLTLHPKPETLNQITPSPQPCCSVLGDYIQARSGLGNGQESPLKCFKPLHRL